MNRDPQQTRDLASRELLRKKAAITRELAAMREARKQRQVSSQNRASSIADVLASFTGGDPSVPAPRRAQQCISWQQSGTCQFGTRCAFLHEDRDDDILSEQLAYLAQLGAVDQQVPKGPSLMENLERVLSADARSRRQIHDLIDLSPSERVSGLVALVTKFDDENRRALLHMMVDYLALYRQGDEEMIRMEAKYEEEEEEEEEEETSGASAEATCDQEKLTGDEQTKERPVSRFPLLPTGGPDLGESLPAALLEEVFGASLGANRCYAVGEDVWLRNIWVYLNPGMDMRQLAQVSRFFFGLYCMTTFKRLFKIRVASLPSLALKLREFKERRLMQHRDVSAKCGTVTIDFTRSCRFEAVKWFRDEAEAAEQYGPEMLESLPPGVQELVLNFKNVPEPGLVDIHWHLVIRTLLEDAGRSIQHIEVINESGRHEPFHLQLVEFFAKECASLKRLTVCCWTDTLAPIVDSQGVSSLVLSSLQPKDVQSLMGDLKAGIQSRFNKMFGSVKRLLVRFEEETLKSIKQLGGKQHNVLMDALTNMLGLFENLELGVVVFGNPGTLATFRRYSYRRPQWYSEEEVLEMRVRSRFAPLMFNQQFEMIAEKLFDEELPSEILREQLEQYHRGQDFTRGPETVMVVVRDQIPIEVLLQELEESRGGPRWNCTQCTFLNQGAADMCQMCQTPRVQSYRQSKPPYGGSYVRYGGVDPYASGYRASGGYGNSYTGGYYGGAPQPPPQPPQPQPLQPQVGPPVGPYGANPYVQSQNVVQTHNAAQSQLSGTLARALQHLVVPQVANPSQIPTVPNPLRGQASPRAPLLDTSSPVSLQSARSGDSVVAQAGASDSSPRPRLDPNAPAFHPTSEAESGGDEVPRGDAPEVDTQAQAQAEGHPEPDPQLADIAVGQTPEPPADETGIAERAADTGSPTDADANSWSCGVCTFINGSHSHCAMCGAPRA